MTARASPDRPWPIWVRPMSMAVLVFLMVFGVELASFTLSIDEEISAVDAGSPAAWLAQGRWGMEAINLLLPDYQSIPVLSTLLFGVGLLYATWCGLRDFRLRGQSAEIYAVIHAGFPLWLHIAEFNTFAAGFGVGIAAAAAGSGLAVRATTWRHRAAAAGLLAFAIAVYQTLAPYALLYACFALLATGEDTPSISVAARARELLRRAIPVAATLLAGVVVYWLVQRAATWVFRVPGAYIDYYWRVDQLRANPRATLTVAMRALGDYLSGRQELYLGHGGGVLALTWCGLLPLAAMAGDRSRASNQRYLLTLFGVVAGLVLLAGPLVLSEAKLPIRSHIVWPLLAAWLASRVDLSAAPRWRMLPRVALAYFAIAACSIGAMLFHTEQAVRDADAAFARQLAPAVFSAAAPGARRPVPFTLVGTRVFPTGGQLRRAGVFGSSFFEHDGGNVRRVALYMRTLGTDGLLPVWLGNRPDLLPAAHSMPIWPAPGSVQRVNGVVIVKIGPPSQQQLNPG